MMPGRLMVWQRILDPPESDLREGSSPSPAAKKCSIERSEPAITAPLEGQDGVRFPAAMDVRRWEAPLAREDPSSLGKGRTFSDGEAVSRVALDHESRVRHLLREPRPRGEVEIT